MRRLLLPLLLLTACVSEDQWSFPLSRAVYDSDGSYEGVHSRGCGSGSEGEAAAALALMLLPIAVDLVLLPVTLPRDLAVHCGG